MTRHNSRSEQPAPAIADVKHQLALELRAEVLGGRGKLPRDASGRVVASFLEQLERPQERDVPRRPGLESLTELLAGVAIAPASPAPSTRLERLEQLERELGALLFVSAPHLWRQIRAPLRRLLNRARRELRAADRADITLE